MDPPPYEQLESRVNIGLKEDEIIAFKQEKDENNREKLQYLFCTLTYLSIFLLSITIYILSMVISRKSSPE